MRVGVLELLTGTRTTSIPQAIGNSLYTKQFASIMPQAIAVWCRQLGHEVFYATWYGRGDPKKKLPDDLDIVFIAAYTQASGLAYALAKVYRADGALTVLGGPHAKSFPTDSLRFFDLVVTQCDKTLIEDILRGTFDKGAIISSGRPLTDVPSVEERMPEIKASAFLGGRMRYLSTVVPLLSSTGCPYTCNFCTDWNNPYALLPPSHLAEDLRYLSHNLPGVKVAFHDPNFAVKFDQTLDVLEAMPGKKRNPYIMESSLSVLRGSRLERLRDTDCMYVAPGIESWSNYSNKAGVSAVTGGEKVRRVAEHLQELHEYVSGIQVNLIFGLDTDEGNEPVELTKEFLTRTPFAWPVINIPVPFGATPLYDDYYKNGRILTSMPFAYYYSPYLVTTLKGYDPVTYYRKLIEMSAHAATRGMFRKRFFATPSTPLRMFHTVRTLVARQRIRAFQTILDMLTSDPQFLKFHEGRSQVLPEFYHHQYERSLGRYAQLISRADRTPELAAQEDIVQHFGPVVNGVAAPEIRLDKKAASP
ncbi:MAG: radical SAM protein [Dehalococcoidia bacterium]